MSPQSSRSPTAFASFRSFATLPIPRPPSSNHAVASVLAARLGMNLQGNPNLNLLFASAEDRLHVGMTGSPYGRRAAFSVFPGGSTQALWVATTSLLPDFEVTLRSPAEHLQPSTRLALGQGFLEARIGVPELDRRFRVVTTLPRLASFLRPALARLAEERFVHLFHSQRAPGLVASFADGPGLPYVLRKAEEHLHALELLACAVEGRRLPARRTFV